MPSAVSSPRDQRIDLLKGFALAMVFVDHLEGLVAAELVSGWTLRAWGPSDAADLFVLLSGVVAGRSDAARSTRSGTVSLWTHAVQRAVVLYGTYAVTALGTLILWRGNGSSPGGMIPVDGAAMATLWDEFQNGLLLQRMPYGLHIFALYLVLTVVGALLVPILCRSRGTGLLLSAVVYAVAQRELLLAPGSGAWRVSGWYYQPIGWQMLFVVGLAAGVTWHSSGQPHLPSVRNPQARLIDALVLAVLLAGWWLRPAALAMDGETSALLTRETRNGLVLLVEKSGQGPLRLLHSVAVLWAAMRIMPVGWAHLLTGLPRAVARSGRWSLRTYCVGVLATVGAVAIVNRLGGGTATLLLVELDGLLLLGGLAAWWDFRAEVPAGAPNSGFRTDLGRGEAVP
jgi:hypothetical protein